MKIKGQDYQSISEGRQKDRKSNQQNISPESDSHATQFGKERDDLEKSVQEGNIVP